MTTSSDKRILTARRRPLQELQEELSGRQQEVSSLQEISAQLLLEAAGEDSVEAKEKVHVICNKLRLLLRRVAGDLHVLHRRLVRPARNVALVPIIESLRSLEVMSRSRLISGSRLRWRRGGERGSRRSWFRAAAAAGL